MIYRTGPLAALAFTALLAAPAGAVRFEPLEGTPFSASLVGIDDLGMVHTGGPSPRVIPLRSIRAIHLNDRKVPAGPFTLELTSGTRVTGTPRETTKEALPFTLLLAASPLEIPLADVRWLVFPGNPRLESYPRVAEDLLLVKRADRRISYRGVFYGLHPGGPAPPGPHVRFRWEKTGKTYKVPFSRIHTLVLPARPRAKLPDGPWVEVRLADGSRLVGSRPVVRAGKLSLDLLSSKGTIRLAGVSVGDVGAVRVHSDHLMFLDDAEPVKVTEHSHFNEALWPLRKRMSTSQGPLRLGGRIHRRGIGVHAFSQLVFDIRRRFDRIKATIGIDDGAWGGATAVFRIWGRFDDPEPTGQTPYRPQIKIYDSGIIGKGKIVEIDRPLGRGVMRRVRFLILEVDFGNDLDLGAHGNWARLRVVKED